MIKLAKYTFRDENATELNELLKKLLSNLEGIEDEIVNEVTELRFENPDLSNVEIYFKCKELTTMANTIAPIIEKIKEILYSEVKWENPYESIKPIQPYMPGPKSANWLASTVKPLILDGTTVQKQVSEIIGVNASTINNRITNAYGCTWKEYVERVQTNLY